MKSKNLDDSEGMQVQHWSAVENAVGPAPWFVYRITPRSALSVTTIEPGGTTRFRF